MKTSKRIISLLLTALLSLTLLPAPAYAGNWKVSAGGGGRWSDTMQGLRITIITPEGKPAFTFGNDPSLTSLDMLYSVKNTDKIDISMGGCKAIDTFYGPFNNTSAARIGGSNIKALKRGIHQNITAFGYMNNAIGIGRGGTNNPDYIWKVVAPDARGATEKYKQLSQVKPVDETGNTWRLNGAKIRQLMYGSTDQTEPDKDAAIHVMFNLYNKDTDKPVWQLTSSGKKYLSEDVIKAYEQGLKSKPGYGTVKLMILGGFAIVVEPIMWGELRNGENSYSGIVLYGTATNIAEGIEELVKNKVWYQPSYKTGGYDVSLYRTTRHSMVLTKQIEYAGQKYTVPSQVKDNSYRVPNKEMLQHTLGWAMHIYVCGADDKTHTWDNNQYPDKTKYVEHPAPNPKEDPPTKPIIDTVKDKLHYNIVKFYEEEVEDSSSPTGKRINHISTHERIETLPKIQVEDEEKAGGYKVVEWKWSSDPKPAIVTGKKADGATEWTDPMIESLNVKPENKSTPKTRISLVDILFQGASKTEGSCRAG